MGKREEFIPAEPRQFDELQALATELTGLGPQIEALIRTPAKPLEYGGNQKLREEIEQILKKIQGILSRREKGPAVSWEECLTIRENAQTLIDKIKSFTANVDELLARFQKGNYEIL